LLDLQVFRKFVQIQGGKKIAPIQYGLVLMAKMPFCEVTLPFFRMRASKAFRAKTGKRFEAFRPLFSPVQQKAEKLPKKIGNEKNGLFAILMNRC
jgi:hypothetical protein